jgi:para-nitrobenzyl esterase
MILRKGVFMKLVTTVENGIVRGLPAADPFITLFKGIPFAAPPVGELRWRAPQPAENWEGVRDAFQFGPIAMQAKPTLDPENGCSREWNADPDISMSEDCLQLNIWTPSRTLTDKLPVYVWYYGGGLQAGNPSEMEYDGERLARRGVVVVTVNYRVNVFGFLAHPELTAESPDAPTNFGHLDQLFGLKWVKRNIAAFGGDPDNITIGGQSAGGMSVCALLVAPQAAGLFQKAIMESGIFKSPYGRVATQYPLAQAEETGRQFFKLLGVKTLSEARSLSADFIRDKALESGVFWGTVDDGKFQIGKYEDEMLKKRAPVPLLFGRTTNEFTMGPNADSIDGFKKVIARYGDKAQRILELCHADEGIEAAKKYSAVSETDLAIRSLCAAEDRAHRSIPKYYYLFGATIPGPDHPGAFHSSDLWFFFETLAKCWRPFTGKHYDLARIMCNYWANFIKTGDPNGKDADGTPMPEWPAYTEKKPAVMHFHEGPQKLGAKVEEPDELMKIFIDARVKGVSSDGTLGG